MADRKLAMLLRQVAVSIERWATNPHISLSTSDEMEGVALKLRTAEKELIQREAQRG